MSKTNTFFSRFEGTRGEKNKYFAPTKVFLSLVPRNVLIKPISTQSGHLPPKYILMSFMDDPWLLQPLPPTH